METGCYVFLHGLGQGPESWGKVLDDLLPRSRVLCPALASLSRTPVVYDSLFQGLREVLEGIPGPVHLCGLSLGAVLALHYAIEQPQKVGSLVLIAGQAAMPKGLLRLQDVIFHVMPERAFLDMGIGKKDAITLTRSMAELDFRPQLGKIACPTLVLCGQHDKPNQKAAQTLHAGIPHSHRLSISGAGHEANLEAPGELAGILEDFWSQ